MKAFRFGLCVLVFIVPLAGCSRALSGDVDSRAVTPSFPPAKPVERPSLIGVSFIDAANGWGITMDSLWKTSDRGETWTKVFTFAEIKAAGIRLSPDVSQVEALPDGKVLVLSLFDGLEQFSPAGDNPRTVFPGDRALIRAFHFADEYHGWVVGQSQTKKGGHWDAVAFSTADGGNKWTQVSMPQGNNCDCGLFDVAETRSGTILVVGDLVGEIDVDKNEFTGALALNKGMVGRLSSIGKLDEKLFWILSNSGNKFVMTDNGGKTWVTKSIRSGTGISDVLFLDATHAIALSGNSIWASDDSGKTWTKTHELNGPARSLYRMPDGPVFAVGDNFSQLPK